MFLLNFIEQLQSELGYAADLQKYQQLLRALSEGRIQPGGQDSEYEPLLRFCRLLFLQDENHQEVFDDLFEKCWEAEMEKLAAGINAILPRRGGVGSTTETGQTSSIDGSGTTPSPKGAKKSGASRTRSTVSRSGTTAQRSEKTERITTRYFHPEFDLTEWGVPKPDEGKKEEVSKKSNYSWQDTDEYFPISRRQMLKAWQFIRAHEEGQLSDEVDIPATVHKLAREQFIAEPVFKAIRKKRENILLILADYRGSMSPFHELTNRIILTARKKGMHETAKVYFFQNYPVDHVYKHASMVQPVHLDKVFSQTNPQFTLTLLISDGGAARGYPNPRRVEATTDFLGKLRKNVANITWLNPMPRQRWWGTSAERILEDNPWLPMFPIFGEDDIYFQRTIQSLFSGKAPIR